MSMLPAPLISAIEALNSSSSSVEEKRASFSTIQACLREKKDLFPQFCEEIVPRLGTVLETGNPNLLTTAFDLLTAIVSRNPATARSIIDKYGKHSVALLSTACCDSSAGAPWPMGSGRETLTSSILAFLFALSSAFPEDSPVFKEPAIERLLTGIGKSIGHLITQCTDSCGAFWHAVRLLMFMQPTYPAFLHRTRALQAIAWRSRDRLIAFVHNDLPDTQIRMELLPAIFVLSKAATFEKECRNWLKPFLLSRDVKPTTVEVLSCSHPDVVPTFVRFLYVLCGDVNALSTEVSPLAAVLYLKISGSLEL